ncbi:MAG TPA: hypothetical protein VEI73_08555 [Candidatus Acidoferrum sp.]|nr:hypothetical protein [Candidatus Acidoferrum sp.]
MGWFRDVFVPIDPTHGSEVGVETRILIVDDSVLVRDRLRDLLQQHRERRLLEGGEAVLRNESCFSFV